MVDLDVFLGAFFRTPNHMGLCCPCLKPKYLVVLDLHDLHHFPLALIGFDRLEFGDGSDLRYQASAGKSGSKSDRKTMKFVEMVIPETMTENWRVVIQKLAWLLHTNNMKQSG